MVMHGQSHLFKNRDSLRAIHRMQFRTSTHFYNRLQLKDGRVRAKNEAVFVVMCCEQQHTAACHNEATILPAMSHIGQLYSTLVTDSCLGPH